MKMRESRKRNPEFTAIIKQHVMVDNKTGLLSFNNIYGNMCINFGWKGEIIVVPYSHVVWLLNKGDWPTEGMHVDHINDDPLDNRYENLQELTGFESQKKRRGRAVYRSYGTGKYGYGIGVHHDKRDNRFYVGRNLSRGHGAGDLKSIRVSFGGFDTLAEAEEKVAKCIFDIQKHGLDYQPPSAKKKPKKSSIEADAITPKLRKLRESGLTVQQISERTGIKFGSVYNRVKDIQVDCRVGGKGK